MKGKYKFSLSREQIDFYKNNSFVLKSVHIGNRVYNVISINPKVDSVTVGDRIKYLINGE